jgi:hypothetical protein
MNSLDSEAKYAQRQAELAALQWGFYPDVADWPAIFSNWMDSANSFSSSIEEHEPLLQNLNSAGAFNIINRPALNYARNHAAKMVGRKWKDLELIENTEAAWAVSHSAREWLKRAIVDAFEIGKSPRQLAKELQESGLFSKFAARMIAHTEIGIANIHSHYQTCLSQGATTKRICLSSDHIQDDVCRIAAEEGEVPVEFVYSGGFIVPPFHPSCRCSASFYCR